MSHMKNDPNSNMQSQSWSSSSSSEMGPDHKLHQHGSNSSKKTECRNGVCHTVVCQNGKCEIQNDDKNEKQSDNNKQM